MPEQEKLPALPPTQASGPVLSPAGGGSGSDAIDPESFPPHPTNVVEIDTAATSNKEIRRNRSSPTFTASD